MGSDGSHGPRPWTQHQASTIFLRVPWQDWKLVRRGLKTEFRAASGAASGLKFVDPPIPVVAYAQHRTHGYESELMVLEDRWQEPLAAISPESLEREGFDSLAEFRAYWCAREKRRFTPTRMVVAYRVRPFVLGDRTLFAEAIFDRLYGQFLPEAQEAP